MSAECECYQDVAYDIWRNQNKNNCNSLLYGIIHKKIVFQRPKNMCQSHKICIWNSFLGQMWAIWKNVVTMEGGILRTQLWWRGSNPSSEGIGTSVIRGTPKNLGKGGGKAALTNGLQKLIRSIAHSQALGSQMMMLELFFAARESWKKTNKQRFYLICISLTIATSAVLI